ncbi:autophagy protein atg9 [Coemansia sp. RSA 988]|nr:autophagy protein atg9 [Coemansia sp. RSA 988]
MDGHSPNGEQHVWAAEILSSGNEHRNVELETTDGGTLQEPITSTASASNSHLGGGQAQTATPAANHPPAHTRGLTSRLSGRRQRHESSAEYGTSSAGSAVQEGTAHRTYASLYDSQAAIDVPVYGGRNDTGPAAHQRRRAFGVGELEVEDEDAPPPESLLIERVSELDDVLTGQPQGRPWNGPQRHPQEQPWNQHQEESQEYPQDRRQHVKRGGFVRRAARAVHDRVQDIGGQAAELTRLGGPLAPPRRRTREPFGDGHIYSEGGRRRRETRLSYRERALRAWRDARHQDEFFCRVYAYHEGKGATAMVVSRVAQLATLAFVAGLSTFVFGCIDHAKVREQKSLAAVVVPQCARQLPWSAQAGLMAFAAFWVAQAMRTALDVPQLLEMRAFFEQVLGVAAADVSTVAWHEVVERMVRLRDAEMRAYSGVARSRVLAHRLTAAGVVNRIMRRENYMLALFNKELLDIRVPGLLGPHVLTKALEWNLSFCVMNYLFDERGQLRRRFLRESNRAVLSEGLRRRFHFMAVINLMFAPFIVAFLALYGFFRHFEQLYREPGTLASRAFTPYARCKLRNFNEVPHAFHRRLAAAHPKATLYLAQFRNYPLIAVARLVAFVAGAFAALLLLFTVFDNELSLEFEVTRHRTVLFYIGLFSAVLAAARAAVPSDDQEYLHPAWIIRDVLEDLQYMDPAWRGNLHSARVRSEFSVLFSYKLLIFAHELLGVVTTPFIMLFSLPDCAERLVDFFRDFTVHEPGLGYVCSFAAFDFERHGNVRFSAPTRADPRDDRMASNNGKMEQSFLAFKADYPGWQPRDQAASIFLQRAEAARQDLWRSTANPAWQDRLLRNQHIAGSVYPTGTSLYTPHPRAGFPTMAPVPEGAPPAGGSSLAAAASTSRPASQHPPNTLRSQFAFQPPGFTNLSQHQPQQLSPRHQSLASQALLPFGPTLGAPVTSAKDKQPMPASSDRLPDHLALSSLPLVASPDMGNSMTFSAIAAQQPRTFSILNHLYEQQGQQ